MIKYVLEQNQLTKSDPNDRYARVVDARARTEDDIAEAIERRNIAPKSTVHAIFEAMSEITCEWLADGDSVNTQLAHFHHTIPGVYREGEHPTEATVKVTPSKEVINAGKKARLHHTEPVAAIRIEFVHDVLTDTTNSKVTRSGTVKLSGHNIKIAGENPTVGVEFLSQEDPEAIYRVTPKNLLINKPSELMFIAPAMVPDEQVVVRVTTQFAGNKNLKAPRSYTFDRVLTVAAQTDE
jgi:hypothetical protein